MQTSKFKVRFWEMVRKAAAAKIITPFETRCYRVYRNYCDDYALYPIYNDLSDKYMTYMELKMLKNSIKHRRQFKPVTAIGA